MPVEMATRLYDEIVEAGADLGFRDAGMYALTALRIEVGYRAWGHDVTPDDTPLEAGLAFALKLKTDIPFKGRDALLAERAAGLKRRLVHIRFDDPDVFPLGDEPILREGRIVGQVTQSPFLRKMEMNTSIDNPFDGKQCLLKLSSKGTLQTDPVFHR